MTLVTRCIVSLSAYLKNAVCSNYHNNNFANMSSTKLSKSSKSSKPSKSSKSSKSSNSPKATTVVNKTMMNFFLFCSMLQLSQATRTVPHNSTLLPTMPANTTYNLVSYGPELKANKAKLIAAMEKAGTCLKHRPLFMAMAMIETKHISIEQRDETKDNNTDGSANVSVFNLSHDIVQRLGYTNPLKLNDEANLTDAIKIIQKGITRWGLTRFLNFVRGGYTAFQDGVSYGAWDFRNAVATAVKVIRENPQLMTDDRRVEMQVDHV